MSGAEGRTTPGSRFRGSDGGGRGSDGGGRGSDGGGRGSVGGGRGSNRKAGRLPGDRRTALLYTTPALIYLALLFAWPLAVIGAYSFANAPVADELTLDNYRRAFDPIYLSVLLHSAWLALATTLICIAVAYPCVLAIRTLRPGRRVLILALLVVPAWLNLLVKNFALIVILRREGVLNSLLRSAGIIDEPLPLLFNDTAVLIGLVHTFLPYMVLCLYAAVDRMDWSLVEAARDLGARGYQVFLRVILPQTRAGLLAGSILVFIPALGAYVTPDLLGGPTSLMVANIIEAQVLQVRDWPFAAALSMVLITIVSLLALGLRRAARFAESGAAG